MEDGREEQITGWYTREVRQKRFLTSLSGYMWTRFNDLPVNWWYVGTVVVVLTMLMSLVNRNNSMVGVTSTREAIERAAKAGDYELAQDLYEQCQVTQCHDSRVLGAESELEDLVYPERRIEREIVRYEELNTKYPGSRAILITLYELYKQVGEEEKAKIFWEQARILDPNNEIFR